MRIHQVQLVAARAQAHSEGVEQAAREVLMRLRLAQAMLAEIRRQLAAQSKAATRER